MPHVSLFRLAILDTEPLLLLDGHSCLSTASQKAGDTDVLVNARPVNALTLTNQPELGSLLVSCVEKSREPSERHADPAAVCK
jgi:hypothetical protein